MCIRDRLTITTNSFENDVLRADKPVLVDFWAQWCPYCRRIAPAFDKVGEQYADILTAGKINYDEEPQLIQRFGIDTIPTLTVSYTHLPSRVRRTGTTGRNGTIT